MPYLSRRQQRWAHATHQPFARRWDKETPDFAALPEKKDAGAEAGAPLHGPGGLLGTPGIRSQRRARRAVGVTTKPMSRSEAARVAALARWRGHTRQQQPAGRGRKPAKTEAQRQSELQAHRTQRDQERQAQHTQNRADVFRKMNIAPDGQAALEALRRGEQPDPQAIARGGFVDAGLVEQAADGSYRMTPAGRALMSSAESGDAGRVGDTISSSRDRLSQRRARQAEQARRRQEAQQRRVARTSSSSGGSKQKEPPKPKPMSAAQRRRLQRAQQRIADTVQRVRERRTTKAQTDEERAMFAKMGGGGKGGSSGGGAGWKKGPDGKRHPNATQVDAMQAKLDADKAKLDKNPPKDRVALMRARAQIRERQERIDDHKERAEHAIDKLDHGLRDKRNEIIQRQRRVKPGTEEQRYLSSYLNEIDAAIQGNKRKRREIAAAGKSFTVYKDHTGAHRWLARSTTAYRDRDREILSTDALDRDSQRMTATKQFGPLRWWHVGLPDPFDPVQPWGPGLDLGDCDFSIQIGRTRVESGTFKSEAIGRRIAATADQYELSPGFFHPVDEPAPDGVFAQIRTFERSLVPTRYGRASNLFTGLTVKGDPYDPTRAGTPL